MKARRLHFELLTIKLELEKLVGGVVFQYNI